MPSERDNPCQRRDRPRFAPQIDALLSRVNFRQHRRHTPADELVVARDRLVIPVSLVLTDVITSPLLAEHNLSPLSTTHCTWQVGAGMVYFLVAAALVALGMGTLLPLEWMRRDRVAHRPAPPPGVLGIIGLDCIQQLINYLPLPAATAFLTAGDATLVGPRAQLHRGASGGRGIRSRPDEPRPTLPASPRRLTAGPT